MKQLQLVPLKTTDYIPSGYSIEHEEIPSWVRFVAMDDDGSLHGFEVEPSYYKLRGCWTRPSTTRGCLLARITERTAQNSLQEVS